MLRLKQKQTRILKKRYPGIIIYVSTRSTKVKQEYRQCQFVCFDFGVHGSLVTKTHVSNTMIYCTIKYSLCVISCKFSAPYLSLLIILSLLLSDP